MVDPEPESQETTGRPHILVVEAPDGAVAPLLRQSGYSIHSAVCGPTADSAIDRHVFDAVVVDTCYPGEEGLRTVRRTRAVQPDAPLLVTTVWGSVESAVAAMRLGAVDYMPQPVSAEQLLLAVERALERRRVNRELATLRRQVARDIGMVGRAPAMEEVFERIERVAPTRARVLITGETGTGKEMAARAIHRLSSRRRRPFVPVSCAQLAPTVLESELFGHTKGAFTGAVTSRRGLFEEAAGGTLFLDEVASIPPNVQVKLLRVLQDRVVQRVGSNARVPVDFRLVVATNADLESLMLAGSFRDDLYYRINVFPIVMPPLRKRKTDIPLLALHFTRELARENDAAAPAISEAALDLLLHYDWPGNVREMENVIERAMVSAASGGTIEASHIVLPKQNSDVCPWESAFVEDWDLARLERRYITEVLRRAGGNKNQAARILRIDRRTLYRKLERWREEEGIQKSTRA